MTVSKKLDRYRARLRNIESDLQFLASECRANGSTIADNIAMLAAKLSRVGTYCGRVANAAQAEELERRVGRAKQAITNYFTKPKRRRGLHD